MNYYNPYFNAFPYMQAPARTGIFARLFGPSGIKLGSILSGTQKVLGVANQAIPMIKQVKPVVKNAKTMFKVMNEFKKVDSGTIPNETNTQESTYNSYNDGPTFFI